MEQVLTALKPGQNAVITRLVTDNDTMYLKLMEMGCTPGEAIAMERIAPLGDPIVVSVSGYILSLRKEEAMHIMVGDIKLS
jgi:ferrous iron transport protein A